MKGEKRFLRAVSDLLGEVEDRLVNANEDLHESREAGVNSAGFNQDLGTRDALLGLTRSEAYELVRSLLPPLVL